jgi:hypothetical protein
MLLDVKHNPGIRIPAPVKHIQYTENHPDFRGPIVQENGGYGDGGAGAYGGAYGGAGGSYGPDGTYCPPQQ